MKWYKYRVHCWNGDSKDYINNFDRIEEGNQSQYEEAKAYWMDKSKHSPKTWLQNFELIEIEDRKGYAMEWLFLQGFSKSYIQDGKLMLETTANDIPHKFSLTKEDLAETIIGLTNLLKKMETV